MNAQKYIVTKLQIKRSKKLNKKGENIRMLKLFSDA